MLLVRSRSAVVAVLCAVFFIAGCAGVYSQPDATQAHAVLTMLPPTGAPSMAFVAWGEEACGKSSDLGVLGSFNFRVNEPFEKQTVRLKTGVPIFISAAHATSDVVYPTYNTRRIITHSCKVYFSLVPSQGERYMAQMTVSPDGCNLKVVDEATQQPPKSLKFLPRRECIR